MTERQNQEGASQNVDSRQVILVDEFSRRVDRQPGVLMASPGSQRSQEERGRLELRKLRLLVPQSVSIHQRY